MDHHQIVQGELSRRDGHDLAVPLDPGGLVLELEQLADGAARAGRGEIADPVAELDQPGDDRTGQRVALHEGGDDRQRVEEVDVEARLVVPHPPGTARDRQAVPQHQRHVDREQHGITRQGKAERDGRQQQRLLGRRHLRLGRRRIGILDVRLGRQRLVRGRCTGGKPLVEHAAAQVLQQDFELVLARGIVFHHQAGAALVDPRRPDVAARPQPRQSRFGYRRLSEESRRV